MPVLTFPDGAKRDYAPGTTGFDVAKAISPSLAKRTVAMAKSAVDGAGENVKLPSSGWTPGVKHKSTGPFVSNGAIAPHVALSEVPSITAALDAMIVLTICTAFAGVDESS